MADTKGLPDVEIEILNNQTGGVAGTEDNIAGLIISGVATDDLALTTPIAIFSLEEAVALGITEAYDTTNTTDAYKQIRDFYSQAPKGTELWIMIIAKTVTMETACDKTGNVAKKMLTDAEGRISIWGITRVPDGGYTASYDDGLDDDVIAAILKAHALNEEFSAAHSPCRSIVGGRDFQSDAADLKDLTLMTQNTVNVVLGSLYTAGYPAVGFILGTICSKPIQRKISRVKDGDLGITDAYLSDGETIESYEASLDSIAKKGYTIFRKFKRKSGYYWSSDRTCCPKSDDFNTLVRGRVMDKAHRITYDVFVNELEDDLELDTNGYMEPSLVKDFQQKIINALDLNMIQTGNASAAECIINPVQNIIATDKVQIEKLAIIPKGYSTFISIPLSFSNPASN